MFQDTSANPNGGSMECKVVDSFGELTTAPADTNGCAECSADPSDKTYCDTSNANTGKCFGKCCTKAGHAWCPTSSCIANGLGDVNMNCVRRWDGALQGSARCPLPLTAECTKFDNQCDPDDSTTPHCECAPAAG